MFGRKRAQLDAAAAQAASAYALSATLLFGLVEAGKLSREEAETILRASLRVLTDAPIGLGLPPDAAERAHESIAGLLRMLLDDAPDDSCA